MEITEAQYERIAPVFPVQRGNVRLSNLQVLNAMLYVAEQGCKWRGLPSRFGNWHTVYTRMNRWSKNGVLDRVFEYLQREQIVRVKLEAVSMDSTIVKVHPDGTGALKKTDSDLTLPISLTRTRLNKQVGVIDPSERRSFELYNAASWYRPLRRGPLGASLFPDTLADADGAITKPAGW